MYAHEHSDIDTTDGTWYGPQERGVSVHTGFPNPAIDTTTPQLDLNRLLIRHSTGTYLMRIAGNSWQQVGIFDGDIAIVDRVLAATPNSIVVWWQDGDFAISARNRMRPDATVWGVVTATIHQLTEQQGAAR
ncbi:peptidase S24 [Candidatus Saccharibacteria bacterium]|nr:MAG: peptidase S24 [Candidatus Saccharibacteria bacterium]